MNWKNLALNPPQGEGLPLLLRSEIVELESDRTIVPGNYYSLATYSNGLVTGIDRFGKEFSFKASELKYDHSNNKLYYINIDEIHHG